MYRYIIICPLNIILFEFDGENSSVFRKSASEQLFDVDILDTLYVKSIVLVPNLSVLYEMLEKIERCNNNYVVNGHRATDHNSK